MPKRSLLVLLAVVLLAPAAAAQRGGSRATPDDTSPYICASARGTQPEAKLSSPFARAVVLNVQVGKPGEPFDEEAADGIATALQQAAAAWRYACPSCSAANVLAIEIHSYTASSRAPKRRTLLFSPLAEYLRVADADAKLDLGWLLDPKQTMKAGAFVHPLFWPHGDIMERFTNRTRAPAGVSLYESPTEQVRSRLCDSAESDGVITPLKAAVGCASKTAAEGAALFITQSDTPTLCKGGLNTIACEKVGAIELLTTNSFVIQEKEEVTTVLGLAGPQADLVRVLMHEIGHWLGLPHFDAAETDVRGIMRSSIENDACIDAVSIRNLGKPFERQEGMALTRANRRR